MAKVKPEASASGFGINSKSFLAERSILRTDAGSIVEIGMRATGM